MGDIAGAKETALLISDRFFRTHAYRDIAMAQVEAGDMAGARETAALSDKIFPEAKGINNTAIAVVERAAKKAAERIK